MIAPGRGRTAWMPDGAVDQVVELTLRGRPDLQHASWTTRSLAEKVGISKDSVQRIWAAHGLRPWQETGLKALYGPDRTATLSGLVGLLADGPERALVVGHAPSEVHAGARPLPAAREAADRLIGALLKTQRPDDSGPADVNCDLAATLDQIDRSVGEGHLVYALVDPLSAAKASQLGAWLATERRARWQLQLMPSRVAWDRVASHWLRSMAERADPSSPTVTVEHLAHAVGKWVDWDRRHRGPFVWSAPARS